VAQETLAGGEAEAGLVIYLAILTNSRKIFYNRNRVEKKYKAAYCYSLKLLSPNWGCFLYQF
jgi:hypothetical protein